MIESAIIMALAATNLWLLAWNIVLRSRIKTLRREFQVCSSLNAWNWRQLKQWSNN